MIKISPEFDEEIPHWDVALEALLREEYGKNRTPLTVDDVHRLSERFVIRFDDLMLTLFELTVRGRWRYMPSAGVIGEITREQMNALWADGRVDRERAITAYPGGWRALG